MSARPRPVTATVTKPAWMQVPEADALAHRRRHSLTSNGSTASLTSVLDHDSYISEGESHDGLEERPLDDFDNKRPPLKPQSKPLQTGEGDAKVKFTEEKVSRATRIIHRRTEVEYSKEDGMYGVRRSASSDSGLSAWEFWLIEKVKVERRQRIAATQQKKKEKQEKTALEQEKQKKLQIAEVVRKDWLEHKNTEEKLSKKLQRLKLQNDKRLKQQQEERIRAKAQEKFTDWVDAKRREERERRQRAKEERQKEEEMRKARQEQAEAKYQEWLKRNKKQRPKSAPPQKVSGYYPNTAYPKPGYVNPIPWHHPPVPKVKQEKPKPKKPARRYVWNPDKYY